MMRAVVLIFALALTASCSQLPSVPSLSDLWSSSADAPAPPQDDSSASAQPPKRGKFYLDDGPPDDWQEIDVAAIADAVPRYEKPRANCARPYIEFGARYQPLCEARGFRQEGVASWYGRRYHGNLTAMGEVYDVYKMTAAHPTLPLPSYARVTNKKNGRSVVVRVNDRGPFLGGRIIDLSFAAAHKLDIARHGTGEVIVEVITPDDGVAADKESGPKIESVAAADIPQISSAQPVESVPLAAPPSEFAVQVGAFAEEPRARAVLDSLRKRAPQYAARIREQGGLFRVLVFGFADQPSARIGQQRLSALGFNGFLVSTPKE